MAVQVEPRNASDITEELVADVLAELAGEHSIDASWICRSCVSKAGEFFCSDCVLNGNFTFSKNRTGSRFSDRRLAFLEINQKRLILANDLLDLSQDLHVEEDLSRLIARKKWNTACLRERLNVLRTKNDVMRENVAVTEKEVGEKNRRFETFQQNFTEMKKKLVVEGEILNAKKHEAHLVEMRIIKKRQNAIKQVLKDIFPLIELDEHLQPLSVRTDPVRTDPVRTDPVRTDTVRTDTVRTADVRTDPVRTSDVRTDPVRTDPVRTDTVRTSDVRTADVRRTDVRTSTVRTGDVRTAVLPAEYCRVLEPILPLNGNYSAYHNYAAQKGHVPAEGNVRNPLYEVPAGLGMTAQLLHVLIQILDFQMPDLVEFSLFLAGDLDESSFQKAVYRLNWNILTLSSSQGLKVEDLPLKETLGNLLKLIKWRQLGRTGPYDLSNVLVFTEDEPSTHTSLQEAAEDEEYHPLETLDRDLGEDLDLDLDGDLDTAEDAEWESIPVASSSVLPSVNPQDQLSRSTFGTAVSGITSLFRSTMTSPEDKNRPKW